jgi:hypothetical protein
MRGVSKHAVRVAAALALLTMLSAPSAFAATDASGHDRLFDRLERAKRFIVTVFSRLSTPPG